MPNLQMSIADLIAYDTKEDELYADYRRRIVREARERDQQSIDELRNSVPNDSEKGSLLDLETCFATETDVRNTSPGANNNDPHDGSFLDFEDDCIDDYLVMFDEQHSNDYSVTIKYPTRLGINYRTRSRYSKEIETIKAHIRTNRLAKNYEEADDSKFLITHGRQWKASEVERLISLVRRFGINFDPISIHFPTRPKRCIAAYFKKLYKKRHSGLLRALDEFNTQMETLKERGPDSNAGDDCLQDELKHIHRLVTYERECKTINIGSDDLLFDIGDNLAKNDDTHASRTTDQQAGDSATTDTQPISHLDILAEFLDM